MNTKKYSLLAVSALTLSGIGSMQAASFNNNVGLSGVSITPVFTYTFDGAGLAPNTVITNQPKPTVTREALVILLYCLIASASTCSAFAIDPSGRANVSTHDGQNVLEPGADGRYDLAPTGVVAAARAL